MAAAFPVRVQPALERAARLAAAAAKADADGCPFFVVFYIDTVADLLSQSVGRVVFKLLPRDLTPFFLSFVLVWFRKPVQVIQRSLSRGLQTMKVVPQPGRAGADGTGVSNCGVDGSLRVESFFVADL